MYRFISRRRKVPSISGPNDLSINRSQAEDLVNVDEAAQQCAEVFGEPRVADADLGHEDLLDEPVEHSPQRMILPDLRNHYSSSPDGAGPIRHSYQVF